MPDCWENSGETKHSGVLHMPVFNSSTWRSPTEQLTPTIEHHIHSELVLRTEYKRRHQQWGLYTACLSFSTIRPLGCRLESHQDAYHLGHQEVKEEIGQGEKSSSKEGDLEESPEKEKNFEFLIIDIQKEKEN